MNPLEQHPHLFANGQFKMKYRLADDEPYRIGVIDGVRYQNILMNGNNCPHLDKHDITLIARSIEDMTDEEVKEFHKVYDVDVSEIRKDISLLAKKKMYREEMLYLLSIGVYPFDQSHFDDGTVIDSRTI